MAPTVEYLEDFVPGHVYDVGSFALSEQEIIEFGTRFDPQPFHTDPQAAKDSIYGGLIASGWHSVAATMRLLVDNFIPHRSGLGSPGIDELRWLAPVRPGVTYSARYTIDTVKESQSKPDRGVITATTELRDPDGNLVMRFRGAGLYLKRPAR